MSAPTRKSVLNEYGTATCVKGRDCTHFDCVAERKMADEIVRLRTLADDDAAVERACDAEDLHVASAGIDGHGGNTQEDRVRAALRAALGGAV